MTNEVDIKDFTVPDRRVKFSADGEVYEAYTSLGLPAMQEMVKVSKNMGELAQGGSHEAILSAFDQILVPESAKRFRDRALSEDRDVVLDIRKQLVPILHYLLEAVGVRPTQPSSD